MHSVSSLISEQLSFFMSFICITESNIFEYEIKVGKLIITEKNTGCRVLRGGCWVRKVIAVQETSLDAYHSL
jgi:hypothetical protein